MELAKFKGKTSKLFFNLFYNEMKKTKVVIRERQGTSRAWIEFLPKHQMTMFGLFPCTASSLAPSSFYPFSFFFLSFQ